METEPLKILHLDTERQWRGGQQQILLLHLGLLQRGVKSSVVCLPGSELAQRLQKLNLPFHCLPWRGEADLPAAWRLAGLARRVGTTVMHLHSAHALSWGLLARLFYPSVKLLVTRRVAFMIRNNLLSRVKYWSRAIDLFVAVTNEIGHELRKQGVPPERVAVIPSGIDIHKFDGLEFDADWRQQHGIEREAVLVGTAAAFTAEKDYPTFLRAAALARKEDSSLRFLVLGEGPLLGPMRQLAVQLGLADKIVFAGFQPEVGRFLKACDIFVLSSRREGLNNAVLDAMCLGLPVVATQVGGLAELVEPNANGMLFASGRAEELAQAILILARDPAQRVRMGQASRDKVRAYDQTVMVERYLQRYQEL